MSGAAHRANLGELRRRVLEESQLGAPVPAVSPAIATLLVDLVAELGAVVLELELLEGIGSDLAKIVDVEVSVEHDERERP